MKKIVCLLLTLITMLCFCCACEKGNYTITFVQSGQENIVKQVERGKKLTDIPTPIAQDGYDIYWDITDFSTITGDTTVNAVIKPKTFTITYTYNELMDNAYEVVLEKTTQDVLYNSEVSLATASAANEERTLVFNGWKEIESGEMFNGGKYAYTRNITLIAVFSAPDSEWS